MRLQVDVSPADAARFDALVERLGDASRAETLRRALSLLALAVVDEMILRRPDGSESVVKFY